MARTATPGSFFEVAMRLLAGPGLPALRIGRLCRDVGVTSGSFYHHFENWDAFVAALLEHWAAEEVDRIVELVRREDDAVRRIELMKRLALTVPHAAERAIRRWAGTDDRVAAVQQRVDDRRRAALREVLAPVVDDDELVATFAEIGLGLLVGYQQLHSGDAEPDPTTDLDAQLDQFETLVRSHVATGADTRG
jgi:AcrR family transcriptional regulator